MVAAKRETEIHAWVQVKAELNIGNNGTEPALYNVKSMIENYE